MTKERAKSERKSSSRRRGYYGQEFAEPLIDFLNSRKEGVELLEALIDAAATREAASMPTTEKDWQRMAKALSALPKTPTPPGVRRVEEWKGKIPRAMRMYGPGFDRPRPGHEKAHAQALLEINDILSKFRLTTSFIGTVRKRWQVHWIGEEIPNHLTHSFLKLIHLAELGLLPKVKRCEDQACRKWFFQAFPHKRYHSKECATRTYWQEFKDDPERVTQRQRWAQDYYKRFIKPGRARRKT